MKESTGELSMVILVLVAVALLAAFLPGIIDKAGDYIDQEWGELTTP